jgi:hypothetical protein
MGCQDFGGTPHGDKITDADEFFKVKQPRRQVVAQHFKQDAVLACGSICRVLDAERTQDGGGQEKKKKGRGSSRKCACPLFLFPFFCS